MAAVITLLATAFCSCSGRSERRDADTAASDTLIAAADYTATAVHWADSVMAGMTLRERVGQLVMPALYADASAPALGRLAFYADSCHVGGVILLKGSMEAAAAIADTLSRMSKTAPWIAIDAEWGLAMRLSDAPEYPSNRRLGDVEDDGLLYDYGYEVARECRRLGINMLFGPVLDVADDPDGPVGVRSFGSDPRKVARLSVAYARGVEDGAVISVAKHFPGHGSPKADSHNSLPVIERSLHELDSIDLVPFRAYVEAGLSAVMVGHLAVVAIDPLRRSAALSPVVIGDLLRGELGFRGLVLTDALNMKGATGGDALDAIAAGADIVLSPRDTRLAIDEVVAAVESGKLPAGEIDDRCRRVLFYKYKAGLDMPRRIPAAGIRHDVVTPAADTIALRLRRASR